MCYLHSILLYHISNFSTYSAYCTEVYSAHNEISPASSRGGIYEFLFILMSYSCKRHFNVETHEAKYSFSIRLNLTFIIQCIEYKLFHFPSLLLTFSRLEILLFFHSSILVDRITILMALSSPKKAFRKLGKTSTCNKHLGNQKPPESCCTRNIHMEYPPRLTLHDCRTNEYPKSWKLLILIY